MQRDGMAARRSYAKEEREAVLGDVRVRRFDDTYADGSHAVNHRVQFSGFFIF